MTPPQRGFPHRQHRHLDEARVPGAAFDLIHREFDVLQRHHDGGAQARIAVEPLRGDPVVDRAGEGARHVLVEAELHPVKAIADGQVRAPAVEHLGPQRGDIGRRAVCGIAKIGPRRDRRIGRIADAVEALDAAVDELSRQNASK
jgi:hypothetical protein